MKTPDVPTKPGPARRTARERLSLLLWGYMPYVVPAADALEPLSDPTPEVAAAPLPDELIERADPSPDAVALARHVIAPGTVAMWVNYDAFTLQVARVLDTISTPEACLAELKARRALEIVVPDVPCVYIDRSGLAHNVEDLEPGLRLEVEAAIGAAAGPPGAPTGRGC